MRPPLHTASATPVYKINNVGNTLNLANVLSLVKVKSKAQYVCPVVNPKTNFTHSRLVKFNSQALWAAEVQVFLRCRARLVDELMHSFLLAVKLLPGCQCDLGMTVAQDQ